MSNDGIWTSVDGNEALSLVNIVPCAQKDISKWKIVKMMFMYISLANLDFFLSKNILMFIYCGIVQTVKCDCIYPHPIKKNK